MEIEQEIDTTPFRQIGYIIGIFVLVGIGGGLTGAIGFSQLGGGGGISGGIISGLLTVMILVVMALLGPVVAVIASLRSADELGGNWVSYLTCLIGSVAGYFVMIILAISIIIAGLGISSGLDGSQDTGSVEQTETPSFTSTPSAAPPSNGATTSGSTPNFGNYVLPIVALAIPSGLAGLGAAFIGGRTGLRQGSGIGAADLPTRSLVGLSTAIVAVIIVIVGAAVLTPGGGINFGGGDPSNILITEQESGFYNEDGQLYGEARLTHTGNIPITTSVTARMVINGNVDGEFSTTEEITLEPGESRTVRISIAQLQNGVVGASTEQQRQIDSDNFEFQFLINEEVRYWR